MAVVNIVTGIVNLALSTALVQRLGLVGVALGTLIPVAVASICVLFPNACRRGELPVAHAFRRAVWPAAIAGVSLAFIRPYLGAGLLGMATGASAGCVLNLACFVLAVGRRDREQYSARLWELVGHKRDLVPAI